jgi:hypothetical protein
VKPRIFIGSSLNARKYAEAIHDGLVDDAECTTWTEGAFGLSESTVTELMKNLRDSDFGVFVFAPDDTATINGSLFSVTRDNVVYESGLFGGYLTPARCFIVVPTTTKIRIPTDLLGMTVGHYEDDRTDKKAIPAVSSFCRQVREKIHEPGLFDGSISERIRELSVKFECCNWIPEDKSSTDPFAERGRRKRVVFGEIGTFCESHKLNKHRLLAKNTGGHSIILLTAIIKHPEEGDCDLIQQITPEHVGPGFARTRLMDAAEAIKAKRCCTREQLQSLSSWLRQLPSLDATTTDRITKLSSS